MPGFMEGVVFGAFTLDDLERTRRAIHRMLGPPTAEDLLAFEF